MIKRLQKNNTILCTSRDYREVKHLARLRRMKLHTVGRHGGQTKKGKLDASLDRMTSLTRLIQRFGPDVAVSFSSPEAARVAFGLGIRHVTFSDSPHAEAVMRLTLPLVQKLLIPWIIPKKEFIKYGIAAKDIIPYRAIDAAIIVKSARYTKSSKEHKKKNILIRIEESQAAYVQQKNHTNRIIQKIVSGFPTENVIVLPRYRTQILKLKRDFGKKLKILDKVVVGSTLLSDTDLFIGSGGTMTAEAALLGIPTVSYNAVPNLIQDYLVREKLVVLQSNPDRIVPTINKMLRADNKILQKRAQRILSSMEDPYNKLIQVIRAS
jgi:predicted glycosyltransferase